MHLRKPTDRLAHCLWLPRFIDKVRAHHSGELTGDYLLAFCHPHAVDGFFLAHFGIDKEAALAAITASKTDREVEEWFLSEPGVNEGSISAWNALAPDIGREGQPGHRELRFMLKRIWGDQPPSPSIRSSFEAILWDERQPAAS